MSQDEGFVSICQHVSPLMFEPLVKDMLEHRGNGSTCVLTQTNEEAAILVALLRKHGLNSKLIQSMNGLRFWNLAEVRMFLKQIDQETHTPIVPDAVWEKAKNITFSKYEDSTSLHYLKRCIQLFENTNKSKYLNDFKEYVFESSVEDFCDLSGADIVVSTIHKSKGQEFDDVYMLITHPQHLTNEILRCYYVGATRAKQRLFIHTNSNIFNRMPADKHRVCQQQYGLPDEIILQLTHKDVDLDFFKPRKKEILALRAGQTLRFSENYLYECAMNMPVGHLSKKMQGELCNWTKKNYFVTSATIRFIVAWRPNKAPKEEKEHAVLLLDLCLNKKT